ncbi:probable GPI-anchored adhesin-like protein PGA55 [Aristolochia californica]|uniref:probable GPI-anchored adhesin-like protein PGA55 n=1 Tax=Aristolochia californica TaxID=171875 RepID=UPI0035D88B2C
MGVDTKTVLFHTRRVLIFSIRTWWKSLCDHPFVWIMMFFTLLVYRFLPSVFAFLVSSSPVIVCTAILLGTLLSFGQPNIPEVEEEEKRNQSISALKSAGPADNLIVDKDASFSVETHLEKREESEQRLIKEEKQLDKDKLIEGRPEVSEKQVEDPAVGKQEFTTYLGSQVDSLQGSSLNQTDDGHDDSSDSGSDHSESSSPDASMTDIMPMLDELHPLLEADAPKASHKSPEDFDGASEQSSQSNESDNGSEELAEDGDNQEEEAQEDQEDQEDGSAVVVTWTEDDEKNLKDIKNLELERNQKMEKLIAKRIATKNQKAMAERNLIDLDTIPIQISPISTGRRNPFDIPFDSNEAMGLPPIPGSAPSVLLPRRNPFDLPFDQTVESSSVETVEKLNHEELPTVHQREAFFRRHESFTIGTSFNTELQTEKNESANLKPYFVVDRTGSEELSVSSFQRQLIEKSDKLSSVHETDTMLSVADQDDARDLLDQESHVESEVVSRVMTNVEQENQSQSSEEVDSIDTEQENSEGHLNASEISFKVLEEDEINHAVSEVVDEKYSGGSSSSASSEGNEKINREKTHDDPSKWSTESIQSSMTEMERAEEVQAVGPVYDSSPTAADKSRSNLLVVERDLIYDKGASSSSAIQDSNVVAPDGGLSLSPVEANLSTLEGETKQKDIGSSVEVSWPISSHIAALDEYESRSRGITEISEEDVIQTGLAGARHTIVDSAETLSLESEATDASHDLTTSSSDRDSDNESQRNLKEMVSGPENITSLGALEMNSENFGDKSISDSLSFNKLTDGNEKPNEEDGVAGQVKEIDESLLSELDAVGNFSVEKNAQTTNLDVVMDSSSGKGMQGSLPVMKLVNLEESSVEVGSAKPQEAEECAPEMEVLEARSLEDIDSAFKQIHGEVEKSDALESVDGISTVIHPNSGLEVVEASSVEDLNLAIKQLTERDSDNSAVFHLGTEKPKMVQSEIMSVETVQECDDPMTKKMGSVEAAAGNAEELTALQSSNEKPQPVKSEVGPTEVHARERHGNPIINETKSFETVEQLNEGDIDDFVVLESTNEKPQVGVGSGELQVGERCTVPIVIEERSSEFGPTEPSIKKPQLLTSEVGSAAASGMDGHKESINNEEIASEVTKQLSEGDTSELAGLEKGDEKVQLVQSGGSVALETARLTEFIGNEVHSPGEIKSATESVAQEGGSSIEDHSTEKLNEAVKEKSDGSNLKGRPKKKSVSGKSVSDSSSSSSSSSSDSD